MVSDTLIPMSQATAQRPRVSRPAAPRRSGGLRRLVFVCLAAVMVAAGLAVAAVLYQARQYDATPTDAIVVLGASQWDGEPSPVLANRLDHAVDLYQSGVANRIITVGGRLPGDFTTEAQAGADYLAQRGIPGEAIVVVPRGDDTITSLRAVSRATNKLGVESVTVVSDRSHLARSAAIADTLGFDAHVSGPAAGDGSSMTPAYVGREAAGLLRFVAYDRWVLDAPR